MKRYFISFSHEDVVVAKFVHAYFNDLFQGLAQFFLSDLMEPGTRWLKRLEKEFSESDGAMFLVSRRSYYRPWINIELGAFFAQKKVIFPLILEDMQSESIPLLSNFQNAYLDNEESVSRLIRAISDE